MIRFTRNEVRDLLIAFVVLSLCFAIATVKFDVKGIISLLPIVMIGVGTGFLLHELGHKFMAMKHGYWAEFKLWPLGLVIAFVTALIGVVFAAPGSVNTYADNMSDEIVGKITLAGPLTNILLALAFIVVAALVYPYKGSLPELIHMICTIGYSVNSFLAAFNLLPFMTLDGIKVLKWNTWVWVAVFALAGTMTIMSISIGAENMVQMIIGI